MSQTFSYITTRKISHLSEVNPTLAVIRAATALALAEVMPQAPISSDFKLSFDDV